MRHQERQNQFHKQWRSFARDDKQNRGTIPMPTCARRPSTMSSLIPVGIPQNPVVGQQRQQISELQIRQMPYSTFIFGCKIRFKNQVTTCSDFPSETLLWIKEVEMVESLEELKSSRSVCWKEFFKMLRCWTRRLLLL